MRGSLRLSAYSGLNTATGMLLCLLYRFTTSDDPEYIEEEAIKQWDKANWEYIPRRPDEAPDNEKHQAVQS